MSKHSKGYNLLNNNYEKHIKYINIAIELAKTVTVDVPIAALIVKDDQIIAYSTNQKEFLNDPTAHAEMMIIKEASQKLGRWRLNDVILYSTLEPCPMCSGAIFYSRIPLVVFSAYDPICGALGGLFDLSKLCSFHKLDIIGGIEEEKSKNLLINYFRLSKNL